jgi:hypothetical protein
VIDPDILAKQRGLSVVRSADGKVANAAPCSKCGAPTKARGRICRACHNGERLPEPQTLSTERIAAYVELLRAELRRRRDELNAALNEEG